MGYGGGGGRKDEDLRGLKSSNNDDAENSSPTKENNGPGNFMNNKQNESNTNTSFSEQGNYNRPFHKPFNPMGHHHHNFGTSRYTPMDLSEVTCFKCGEKGHYANKCNKSFYNNFGNNDHQMNDSDK
jgi:hypothetical protein